jgi:hypothetical protein
MTHETDRNTDGTFNIAWPIDWNSGRPNLITGETSIQGFVGTYDIAGEYDYFSLQYPLRDLSEVHVKLATDNVASTNYLDAAKRASR